MLRNGVNFEGQDETERNPLCPAPPAPYQPTPFVYDPFGTEPPLSATRLQSHIKGWLKNPRRATWDQGDVTRSWNDSRRSPLAYFIEYVSRYPFVQPCHHHRFPSEHDHKTWYAKPRSDAQSYEPRCPNCGWTPRIGYLIRDKKSGEWLGVMRECPGRGLFGSSYPAYYCPKPDCRRVTYPITAGQYVWPRLGQKYCRYIPDPTYYRPADEACTACGALRGGVSERRECKARHRRGTSSLREARERLKATRRWLYATDRERATREAKETIARWRAIDG